MQSKFGWLIAGPVNNSDQNGNVYFNATNLIIDGIHGESEMSLNYERVEQDELVDTLKKFWEIEELGIRKFPEKERQPDATQSSEFLREIEFKEIGLPWKQIDDKPLPNDFQLSLDRLNSLYSRLEKDPEILAEYTPIIDEQIKLGIVEYVPEEKQTREFIEQNNVQFLPHFAVIRKDRETTSLRIVFDGSAQTADRDYSFNDYLETGPNSLPQLFDVLTSFRSNLIAFTSDVEKAFLQVSVKADDRDTLRFFWYETDSNGELKLLQLRFNRLVFGLTPSPAILRGAVQHHLEK